MHALKLLKTHFSASRRYLQSLSKNVPEKVDYYKVLDKNLLPLNYIRGATSNQNLTTHLPAACNHWLQIPQDKYDAVIEVIDYVLQAAILYDDVQDGAQYRRHLPAAHRVYGEPLAMTSAMYCILQGLNIVMSFDVPKAPKMYCDYYLQIMNGIALDNYWRDNYICPTEEEYKAMSAEKLAPYFSMTLSLLQLFSQDQRNYQQLMITLALYFQMRDEYTNLVKVEALEEKSRQEEFKDLGNVMHCEDITEGRFSWAMIHGLSSSEGPTIRSILVQCSTDARIKQHCLHLLEKAGSLEYTRQTLLQLDTDLRDQVRRLGGNPVMIAYLDELCNWRDQ